MLTAKQEKFCKLVADGMTQADAYRAAYNTEKMLPRSVIEKASELMSNVNISSTVASLRKDLADKALWTREESVRVLKEVIEEGRAGDKTSAVKELNLMHGFNAPTKIEHSGEIGITHKVVWE